MAVAPFQIDECIKLIKAARQIISDNHAAVVHEQECLGEEKDVFSDVFDQQMSRLEDGLMAAEIANYHLDVALRNVDRMKLLEIDK